MWWFPLGDKNITSRLLLSLYLLTFLCAQNENLCVSGDQRRKDTQRDRGREKVKKNICIKMTFVASNIAKSINFAWQVLHAIQIKVEVLQMKRKKLIFTLFHTNNNNNTSIMSKLYINIKWEMWMFTFSNDCFVWFQICYTQCFHSFTQNVYCPIMQQYSCNDSTNIHILPHFL